MSRYRKILIPFLLCLSFIITPLPVQTASVKASSLISFIILSDYKRTADIGNEFYIDAITSNGKLPTWKSSDSKIASVNTYGKVTAKKAGTALITAKIKNAEASCRVTVNKTRISISRDSASIEHGETLKLSANTSNNSKIKWKSSKKSIASVDENGTVTGLKPGETIITASADGSDAACQITVKAPKIKLNLVRITLYRCQTAKLSATVSSGISPIWKSNKKSVVTVDEAGTVTAVKHGTATITANVDGVSESCEIVVQKPVITLSESELCLKKGSASTLTADVSSGNLPVWSSSNTSIAVVDAGGKVTALQKGKANIYASEDGTKAKCIIHVTE